MNFIINTLRIKTKVIRKVKRLFGWRKPHPKNIETEFNTMRDKMTKRQAVMEATTNPDSVTFVYNLWNNQI